MRRFLLMGACLLAAAMAPAPAQMLQNPPMLTFTQPVSPQAVHVVQQRLRQSGAYTGAVDGIWGADSQAALERYQQSQGLQVTGQLNQATVASLGIPADQLVYAAWPVVQISTPIVATSLSTPSIQAIQARLRSLGRQHPGGDPALPGRARHPAERPAQSDDHRGPGARPEDPRRLALAML